jgi:hypothetical protein
MQNDDYLITKETLLESLDRYGFESDDSDKLGIIRLLDSTLVEGLVSLNLISNKLMSVHHTQFIPLLPDQLQ